MLPGDQTGRMTHSAQRTSSVELMKARAGPDGTHSSNYLAPRVRSGHALRVRRGVYVSPVEWVGASPWQRYQIAIAATALAKNPVFCRETALMLHGVPLLRVPPAVTARTLRRGANTLQPTPALTGSVTPESYTRRFGELFGDIGCSPSRLRNIPTRLLHPAFRVGQSKNEALDEVRDGHSLLHQSCIAPTEFYVQGPAHYRAEPLELVLIDTVSRMSFADAVVALDWVKAQGLTAAADLEPWLGYLTNEPMRARWWRGWNFADGASESPGESRSRAIIRELGFGDPSLQATIETATRQCRVDFCWEEERIIGEFDGRVKYFDSDTLRGRDPRAVLSDEKDREDALRHAGWRVVRWTWADLDRSALLAARLRDAGVPLLR